MSTLAVVEEILRETGVPMSVREIVERAGVRLPSKSRTPDTVVARDLSMDIKKHADASRFARTSPGRYTMRDLVPASHATPVVPVVMTADTITGNVAAPVVAAGAPAHTTVSMVASALRDSRPRVLPARSTPVPAKAAEVDDVGDQAAGT